MPTNAGFETRVQVRTRGERGRGRGFRVALTREEHRRGHELRAASIQEREGCVKELLGRGGEIRVSNQQRERERHGKRESGTQVLGDARMKIREGKEIKKEGRKMKKEGKKERKGKKRREGVVAGDGRRLPAAAGVGRKWPEMAGIR